MSPSLLNAVQKKEVPHQFSNIKYIFFQITVLDWFFYVCILPSRTYVTGVLRGQKRVSDPLELELQMWAAMWVVLETEPRTSVRKSVLNNWTIYPAPSSIFPHYQNVESQDTVRLKLISK